MSPSGRRRLTLKDTTILIAATAVGIAWARGGGNWMYLARVAQNTAVPESWRPFDRLVRSLPAALPCLATWTVALLVLRLSRPRPRLDRVALQPVRGGHHHGDGRPFHRSGRFRSEHPVVVVAQGPSHSLATRRISLHGVLVRGVVSHHCRPDRGLDHHASQPALSSRAELDRSNGPNRRASVVGTRCLQGLVGAGKSDERQLERRYFACHFAKLGPQPVFAVIAESCYAGSLTHTTLPSGSWIFMIQPTVGISHLSRMILPPLACTAVTVASISSTPNCALVTIHALAGYQLVSLLQTHPEFPGRPCHRWQPRRIPAGPTAETSSRKRSHRSRRARGRSSA